MRWFVCSESELNDLARTWSYAPGPHKLIDTTKAEAACRTRQVPDWATHFVFFSDERIDSPDDAEVWVTQSEKIRR